MSSSSERRLAAVLGFALAFGVATSSVEALSVHAVYRTACSRELGVILRVEKRQIHLLRLDGTLARIPRHEIVSLLYYPLSRLPLAHVPTPDGFPPLRVTTRYQNRVVELVTGWPIDYSENKISFLLRNGKDLVVDRDSIWSLDYLAGRTATGLPPAKATQPVVFVHPQTSGFCADPSPDPTARPVFAQQVLNDQVVIRRELDRLYEGFEQVAEYEKDQKFYPKPFLYRDRTMLGLWVSAFSRYGASSSRSNNFTPLLVDELALGPFRYQHVFLSGAAPNDMLLHHEAQSQIFYRFKAAYFHTSVFFNPNLLLVGTRYGWRADDLEDETLDDRLNEALGIEFGFDWGPLAIELSPAMLGKSAVKIGDYFDAYGEHRLWRAGARLTLARWRIRLVAGLASTDGFHDAEIVVDGEPQFAYFNTSWTYRYGRFDLAWSPTDRLELALSSIGRTLAYDARASEAAFDSHAYDSLSVSNSVQGTYALTHRFSIGGNAIVELQRREGDGGGARTRVLPRLGVFTGFWF